MKPILATVLLVLLAACGKSAPPAPDTHPAMPPAAPAGDAAARSARIALETDALFASALRGKGAMLTQDETPARSDAAVKAAVDHLVAGSR